MKAGELRDRVTLQQSDAVNVDGVPVGDWVDVCTVWAQVVDLSGRELEAQQQTGAEISTRIRIRYRAGLLPQMRALRGARAFDIQAIIDPDGRRRELQLMCKELIGAAPGAVAVPSGWRKRSFTGELDGENQTFVLDQTIPTSTAWVMWNGLKQADDSYTFDGRTFTLSFAPNPGDSLEFWG